MKKILMSAVLVLALTSLAFGEVVSGVFNGQAADPIYIGVGFIPDWVKVYNVEAATVPSLSWSVNNRATETLAGIQTFDAVGTTQALCTVGTGISIYRGGDVLTSTSYTNYLIRDGADRRDSGTGDDVSTWTLDTNSYRAGHFDATPSSTYIGEGSRVCVDGKWATVISMGGDATVAGSVILGEALASGDVNALLSMYDYKVAAEGDVMPAGFTIANATVNASGNICYFEAGKYDEK